MKKEMLLLKPLNRNDEGQMFKYDEHQRLLPKVSQDLAVWTERTSDSRKAATNVILVPRYKARYGMVGKIVRYKDRKGNNRSKTKQVRQLEGYDDISRLLKWSIMPEHHQLALLPRHLRTTQAHSKFFRVPGEVSRADEIEKGAETRFTGTLGDRLVAYSPLFPYLMSAAEGSWKHDKFWGLCQLLGCPLVDRTGTLATPLKLKVLHPIPKFQPNFNSTLPDLMVERAKEILQKYPNQDIQVLWSGGIDTTAVLVAFLTCGLDLKQIIVRYCERSKAEYPLFFEKFVTNLRHELIEGHVRDTFTPQMPTVTGDPADMLMGTAVMSKAFFGVELNGVPNPLCYALDEPWENVIPAWVLTQGLLGCHITNCFGRTVRKKIDLSRAYIHSIPEVKDWLKWMAPFVEAAPIKIVTVFDWLWWVTYACKYQHDLLRVFYNREDVTPELRESCVNFYEKEGFDQWSFHHHAEKMTDKGLWSTYKMPLKKFIFDYTQDKEYWAIKTKIRSVKNSWGYQLAIDENWNVIQFGQYSISCRRLFEKYNSDLDVFIEESVLELRNKRQKDGLDTMVLACRALTDDLKRIFFNDPYTRTSNLITAKGRPVVQALTHGFDPTVRKGTKRFAGAVHLRGIME